MVVDEPVQGAAGCVVNHNRCHLPVAGTGTNHGGFADGAPSGVSPLVCVLVALFAADVGLVYYGTYHKMSYKHLQRYVAEFAARHNVRDFATIDQMAALAKGMEGRRLMYRDLTAGTQVCGPKPGTLIRYT